MLDAVTKLPRRLAVKLGLRGRRRRARSRWLTGECGQCAIAVCARALPASAPNASTVTTSPSVTRRLVPCSHESEVGHPSHSDTSTPPADLPTTTRISPLRVSNSHPPQVNRPSIAMCSARDAASEQRASARADAHSRQSKLSPLPTHHRRRVTHAPLFRCAAERRDDDSHAADGAAASRGCGRVRRALETPAADESRASGDARS